MRHHPSRLSFLTPLFVGGALLGLAILSAATVPQAKRNLASSPGLPPGRPFQILQNEINALQTQVNGIQTQVNGIQTEVNGIKTEVNTLQTEVAALKAAASAPALVWINHTALLPGDKTVVSTSFNSTSSGVGGGLAGLVIQSSTTGATDSFNGNKVVWRALDAPPRFLITGVRVCYELSSTGSFISQIRLSQVQNPPSTAVVILDDPTHLTTQGPVCVDSASTSVDASQGSVLLDLTVNFGNTADKIVIRGLGLHLQPAM
ncbi:MAG TPA: hypothetical protein VFN26_04160 [Candidatus Acidoferrum sp.]|nr:hypothetical protein [Candidatus Acidoferrum sp.]